MDRIFQRASWIVVTAVALAVVAAFAYPGGTPLDSTTQHYSLAKNFLSDLGMTVAYDGQPNKLGARGR